jgi:beta-galactosidase
MVRPMLAPGPLKEVCGFYYQEFSNFSEMSLKEDPFGVGDTDNKVNTWAEYLLLETAEPLAYYDHQYFSEYPAVTTNNYGKGTLIYEGCMLSDAIQEKIILMTLENAGIKSPDQDIQWPVITKSGKNEDGKTVHYYYNYSSDPAKFVYKYKNGKELIADQKVERGSQIAIDPWGVLIIEE